MLATKPILSDKPYSPLKCIGPNPVALTLDALDEVIKKFITVFPRLGNPYPKENISLPWANASPSLSFFILFEDVKRKRLGLNGISLLRTRSFFLINMKSSFILFSKAKRKFTESKAIVMRVI